MLPSRTMLWAAVVVAGVMTPQTQATLALAALPAVASVGGLAALKVLKFLGLSRLRDKVSNSGFGILTNNPDAPEEDRDFYKQEIPIYAPPPRPYFAPTPFPVGSVGPPSFYIVPSSSFDDYQYRKRRDVLQRVSEGGSAGVVAVPEEEHFKVIDGLDKNGCALRAVCEVASAPINTLSKDERAIMAAFSSEHKPAESEPTTWRGKYYQALWIGKAATDAASACAKVYGRCPVPAKSLLQALEIEEYQGTEQAQ